MHQLELLDTSVSHAANIFIRDTIQMRYGLHIQSSACEYEWKSVLRDGESGGVVLWVWPAYITTLSSSSLLERWAYRFLLALTGEGVVLTMPPPPPLVGVALFCRRMKSGEEALCREGREGEGMV